MIFVFSVLGIVFVFAIQSFNPWSAPVWHRPSWSRNPLNFGEPLQFFHLAAFACLASGIVTLLRIAISRFPFYVGALVPVAMSVGVLVGLQGAMFLASSKMERRR